MSKQVNTRESSPLSSPPVESCSRESSVPALLDPRQYFIKIPWDKWQSILTKLDYHLLRSKDLLDVEDPDYVQTFTPYQLQQLVVHLDELIEDITYSHRVRE